MIVVPQSVGCCVIGGMFDVEHVHVCQSTKMHVNHVAARIPSWMSQGGLCVVCVE